MLVVPRMVYGSGLRLAIPGPCQCSRGLNLGPLYLLFILIGPGPKCDEMDLFAFIRHSDPTKVRIGERDIAEKEVKLLKMTEGHTVSLDPPVTVASGGSGDSIDKLFDKGDDVGQEHSVERGDDVLEETIARDVLDVVVEKAKKKQKRRVTGDASGSTHPPKKLREDYQSILPNTSGKSLAAPRGLVPEGSGIPSGVTEPLITASVPPTSDVGPTDSVSGLNLLTCPPNVRYVVSSDDSHHSGSYSEATYFVRSLVADASVVTVAVTTTVVADVAAIPGSKARVESKNLENVGILHPLVGLMRMRPSFQS
ncbi:hypothetical protein Tco_1476714 [Tanacetum coccineum]